MIFYWSFAVVFILGVVVASFIKSPWGNICFSKFIDQCLLLLESTPQTLIGFTEGNMTSACEMCTAGSFGVP